MTLLARRDENGRAYRILGTKCRHKHPNQFPSVPENCMNNSNPSSMPRITLKLKGAARKPSGESRKSSDEIKAPPPFPRPSVSRSSTPRPPGKPSLKSGAHWSDEYKRRMQADMDALTSK
jgi:hypothetical protein